MVTQTKIAITGGPSAGKTSLFKELAKNKKYVLVPEAATLIDNMNFNIGELSATKLLDFQTSIINIQLELEKQASFLADPNQIIVTDRGILDNLAYITETQYSELLKKVDVTPAQVLSRYDAVIHLCSAAVGAEQHYIDNGTRYESIEEAKKLDLRTLQISLNASKFYVIRNNTNFETKIKKAINVIEHVVQADTEIERKWLMKPSIKTLIPEHAIKLDIHQKYEGDIRIRETTQTFCEETFKTYTKTCKKGYGLKRQETESKTSYEEFSNFGKTEVFKTRYIVDAENHVYHIDHVLHPMKPFWLMEEEYVDIIESPVDMVASHIMKDVTDDKSYSNINLAWKIKN